MWEEGKRISLYLNITKDRNLWISSVFLHVPIHLLKDLRWFTRR